MSGGYKYIDDDVVKNIIRNRAAGLEGQIAEARLVIRLMEDSGDDPESESFKQLIGQQHNIIDGAKKHLDNTERYLREMESVDAEATEVVEVPPKKAAPSSKKGKAKNGSKNGNALSVVE